MNYSQKTTKEHVGTGVTKVSPVYTTNVITITGLSTGIVTVRGKQQSNDTFEDVLNGDINLEFSRTITLKNVQIQEFEFTVSPSGAFTATVMQSDALSLPEEKTV